MKDEYVELIINFCNKYKCFSSLDRATFTKALKNTENSGVGLSKELGVSDNYMSKEFRRKLPVEIKEELALTNKTNWLLKILLYYDRCPICNNIKNSLDSATCSYSCSNTLFRSGSNNGNYKGTNYTTICFSYHKKECVVCKESNIVEVHHLDEDHTNNNPTNLIPLCPTHHQYWHSRYKFLIEDRVIDYAKNFKINENCFNYTIFSGS